MYDNIRSDNYSFKNCNHLACSEIRAAKLAGYCSGSFSYFSDPNRNMKRNINCVKSKAHEHMVTYYEHCSEPLTNINAVWDKCYNDDSPVKDFSREKPFLNV
jgi:hypothetical protein